MQKILHFHIPKTGGIAIRHYLIEQLGTQSVSPSVLGNRLSDALVRWRDMPAISGHFSLHQGDQLPSDRCSITVLRDPLDRFLSQYFFAKSDNADRLLDAKVHALDLDSYLDGLTPDDLKSLSSQMEMLYPLGTSERGRLSTCEKLQAATKALELFELVGIQNELDDFSSMMDARFAWHPAPLRLKNVTSQRLHVSALSAGQQSKLKALLEPEFELYQSAKSRFKQLRRGFIRRSISCVESPAPHAPSDAAIEHGPLDAPTLSIDTSPSKTEFGDGRCRIVNVSIDGEISGANHVMIGEQCTIAIDFSAHEDIPELNVGIAIKDDNGLLMFGTNSMLLGNMCSASEGTHRIAFRMFNRMPIGRYHVDVALVRGETHYQGCYHWREGAASFDVHETAATHFEGQILMDADVQLMPMSQGASSAIHTHTSSKNQVRSLGRNNERLTQFASQLAPMCATGQFYAGLDVFVPVQVKNTGSEPWGAYGQQPVTLSYRWMSDNNGVVVADGLRTRLPADIAPGGAAIVPMKIRPPTQPGQYRLVLSLVQESVAWFVDQAPDSSHIIDVTLS